MKKPKMKICYKKLPFSLERNKVVVMKDLQEKDPFSFEINDKKINASGIKKNPKMKIKTILLH